MKTSLTLLALVAALATGTAHANTVVQWNFNSTTADANTSTGSSLPILGAGSISLLGGVTTTGFNSGTGSTDPETADDSGYQTTSYTAQGVGNKTAGVQFNVSTLGYEDVVVSYDLRHSNTSSRYQLFQYSLDGTNFVDHITFDGGTAGDTWFNRSVDLSAIAGADNNASFAFRVVSTFAPDTNAYTAARSSSTYAGGTWRFDMVNVVAAPVPEPETYAMLLAGLGLMGAVARRRKA